MIAPAVLAATLIIPGIRLEIPETSTKRLERKPDKVESEPPKPEPIEQEPEHEHPEPEHEHPVVPASPEVVEGVWSRLAMCESTMTNAATGNGFYGYFQFVPETWNALDTVPDGLPTAFSYEVQRQGAIELQAEAGGFGPWPGCAAQLGLPT